jgi:hypothetical protein
MANKALKGLKKLIEIIKEKGQPIKMAALIV